MGVSLIMILCEKCDEIRCMQIEMLKCVPFLDYWYKYEYVVCDICPKFKFAFREIVSPA